MFEDTSGQGNTRALVGAAKATGATVIFATAGQAMLFAAEGPIRTRPLSALRNVSGPVLLDISAVQQLIDDMERALRAAS